MSDSETFESKVDQLILTCQQLKRDNMALKKRENELISEKNQLVKCNDITKRKVENMISRLRTLSASN
jgi:cell division protein ZapB